MNSIYEQLTGDSAEEEGQYPESGSDLELQNTELERSLDTLRDNNPSLNESDVVRLWFAHRVCEIVGDDKRTKNVLHDLKNEGGVSTLVEALTRLQLKKEGLVTEAVERVDTLLEAHPLSGLIDGTTALNNLTPQQEEEIQVRLTEQRQKNRQFHTKLESILKLHQVREVEETPLESEASATLPELPDQKSRVIQQLQELALGNGEFRPTAENVADVFHELKNREEWQAMINLYENEEMINPIFLCSTRIREWYAVALDKVGRLDDSLIQIRSLRNEGYDGAAEYAIEGKIQKLGYQTARDLIALKQQGLEDTDEQVMQLADRIGVTPPIEIAQLEVLAKQNLDQSVETLEKGFQKSFEVFPGINLMYNTALKAVEENNPEAFQQVKDIAAMVKLAAEREGSIYTANFWNITGLVQAKAMLGENPERELQALLKVATKQHSSTSLAGKLNSTLDNLTTLQGQLKGVAGYEQSLQTIEQVISSISLWREEWRQGREVEALPESFDEKDRNAVLLNEQLGKRGIALGTHPNDIEGNIAFWGQLHDLSVTEWDIGVANQILEIGRIAQITNEKEFNLRIDQLIRQRFNTEQMEDLHSPYHQVFDAFVKKINKVTGLQVGSKVGEEHDARTNITADFLRGVGDCRQHAHVKQLFYELWRSKQIGTHLSQAYSLSKSGQNRTAYTEEMTKAQTLADTHMRIHDSVITAPIALENGEKYQPIRVKVNQEEWRKMIKELIQDETEYDETLCSDLLRRTEGKEEVELFQVTDDLSQNAVEDHSYTQVERVRRVKDAKGREVAQLVSSERADSFYHSDYPLEEGEFDLSKMRQAASAEELAGSHPFIHMYAIQIVNGHKKLRKIEVSFPPAGYSEGGNLKREKNLDRLGHAAFYNGIRVNKATPEAVAHLLTETGLQAIRKQNEEWVREPEPLLKVA